MQSSTSDLGLGVRLAGDNPHLVGFSNVLHKCKPRGTPGSLLSPACRRHEDSGRIVASLDRNCLGQKAFREFGTSLRGIFDKETRRKPLVFAADAGLWGLNRLSPVIDRIYDSCRNGAKVKKANENENVSLRHDSRILAREASAAPAA